MENKFLNMKSLVICLKMIVAFFICVIMLFMFADVVSRYVLNAPIKGGFEIVGLMLGFLVFSSLSLVTQKEDHITVGLLDHWFDGNEMIKKVRDFFVLIANILILGLIAFRVWRHGDTLREEQAIGEYLDYEIAPFIYVMAGFSIVACIIAINLIRIFLKSSLKAQTK